MLGVLEVLAEKQAWSGSEAEIEVAVQHVEALMEQIAEGECMPGSGIEAIWVEEGLLWYRLEGEDVEAGPVGGISGLWIEDGVLWAENWESEWEVGPVAGGSGGGVEFGLDRGRRALLFARRRDGRGRPGQRRTRPAGRQRAAGVPERLAAVAVDGRGRVLESRSSTRAS